MWLSSLIVICLCVQVRPQSGDFGTSNFDWDLPWVLSLGSSKWHYADQQRWSGAYEDCKGGKQSPINVEKSHVKYSEQLGKIIFDKYDVPAKSMTMNNTGNTIIVYVSTDGCYMKFGDLGAKYKLLQFHFHWPSEHEIDGKRYPMEIHFVHKLDEMSSGFMKAKNGLAVLGFFFKISKNDNQNLKFVTDSLDSVKYMDQGVVLNVSNKISDMFPKTLKKFYRYSGSLTTPPCYESVQWTVFDEPILISEAQLSKFKKCQNTTEDNAGQGHDMKDLYRTVQLLNGRTVSTSDPSYKISDPKESYGAMLWPCVLYTVGIFCALIVL